jgi:sulfhydrogenase subunit beta (sulfur reductase)
MRTYSVSLKQWVEILSKISAKYNVFAPIQKGDYLDYELITYKNVELISYNKALPTTPLKAFMFPIKENVVKEGTNKKRVIFGIHACDLSALNLLDKIFLDEDFLDSYYKGKRDSTVLIGSDCYTIKDSCHCTSYGIDPVPKENSDITFSLADHKVILQVFTEKGKTFITEFLTDLHQEGKIPTSIKDKRNL